MKDSKKIQLGIYILFLLTVFLILGSVGRLSQISGWTYFFIVLALSAGTGLFLNSYFFAIQVAQSEQLLDSSIDEHLTNLPEIEEKDIQTTNQLDIVSLIPANEKHLEVFADKLLVNMSKEFHIAQALFYFRNHEDNYSCCGQYAYFAEQKPSDFTIGESISGQAVKNKMLVELSNVPDNYLTIASGLGQGKPTQIVLLPIISGDKVEGLIEFASFVKLSDAAREALEQLADLLAKTIVKLNKKQE